MLATIHSWWTVGMLFTFVGIVLWAYSARRSKDFEEAAMLALDDDDLGAGPAKGDSGESHG